MSCDAPPLTPITLGYADGDGSQPELTAAGRARLAEIGHLFDRCDALRISVCYPPSERRRLFQATRTAYRFEDPASACEPFSTDDLFIRLVALGPND